ncbi:MAG TPA: gluconokinase [Acidothermaceae bacterium]|nr:gluconokinase [Acidothermaceae bacterium]
MIGESPDDRVAAQEEPAKPLVVVMGVSGAGKSTVGEGLAKVLGVPFLDADQLHPQANIDKMASGIALGDADRWPWLAAVGRELATRQPVGCVVACSALRRVYRDVIREHAPTVTFLHLEGSAEILRSRMQGRFDHFMPPSLLETQLACLEPLEPGERGGAVNIDGSIDRVISTAAILVHRTHC